MNILIVYAHHEPTSLTASLKNVALQDLIARGHNVVVSDLYAQGFSALAQKWDFVSTTGQHFNYSSEQKHAAHLGMSFAPDISAEMQKLQVAELVLFMAPMWWFSSPAVLKGWFDRVLAMGVAWDEGKIYEAGLLRGKQAMLVMTAGQPTQYFQMDGPHRANATQLLHHINHGTLAFCGFEVHEPFVVMNSLHMDQAGYEQCLNDFQFRLNNIIGSPSWLIKY